MNRRDVLRAAAYASAAMLWCPYAARAAAWTPYTDLAIKAGAERCAIIGMNGAIWAGSHKDKPSGWAIAIRDVKTLIKDAKARASSSEMHFDGVKFFFTSVTDDTLIGKAGEYACAVKATTQTLVIVITKGTPQSVLGQLAPVVKAVKTAGM